MRSNMLCSYGFTGCCFCSPSLSLSLFSTFLPNFQKLRILETMKIVMIYPDVVFFFSFHFSSQNLGSTFNMKNFISFTFVKVIIYYLLYTFTFCTVIQSSPFGILVSYLWNSCTSNLCPCFLFSQGFPGSASCKEPAFQCRRTEEMQV